MAGMRAQLKVIKADGSTEEYLHTKVIGTISNALALVGDPDIDIAEQLAEVVTYFLYLRQNRRSVNSSEIFSVIKAVLTSTMHSDAAAALSEYNFERNLKRNRIEVAAMDIQELADAEMLCTPEQSDNRCRWNKKFRRMKDSYRMFSMPSRMASRCLIKI